MLAAAQDFGFEPPADATDPALPAALSDLAERVLPAYQEDDPDRYLSNLAALQMVGRRPGCGTRHASLVAGAAAERARHPAGRSRRGLRHLRAGAGDRERRRASRLQSAYGQAFRETDESPRRSRRLRAGRLVQHTDRAAAGKAPGRARPATREELPSSSRKRSISCRPGSRSRPIAVSAAIVRPLLVEDKERRYILEEVAIPVSQDATIAAALVRPRSATAVRDTADAARVHARSIEPGCARGRGPRLRQRARAVAHRGRPGVSPARAVRVGGQTTRAPSSSGSQSSRGATAGSACRAHGYGGFVAWSAAKRLPPALKAIATSDPMAPGIDVPSPNGIFQNSAYRWVYEILASPDDEVANDDARWRGIDEDWYRSGRSYREFPTLPGRASAIFRSWLNHPSYDRFWQKWLPFGDEFAEIDIPVLTVTGYYSAGETAALYYFTQHHQHDANADHALLIGPFDSRKRRARRFVVGSRASVSTRWPASTRTRRATPGSSMRSKEQSGRRILSANVNYELAGANEWRHEPSLAALESNALRFYLAASPNGEPHALVAEKPAPMSLTETLDLRDRTDVGWRPAQELVLREIAVARGRGIHDGALRRAGRRRGPAPRRARLHDQQVRRGLGDDAVRAHARTANT